VINYLPVGIRDILIYDLQTSAHQQLSQMQQNNNINSRICDHRKGRLDQTLCPVNKNMKNEEFDYGF
jgi:hypothetical protein